ncbi:MAG: GxxExxY protein [Phycisphaerales bacterium]
MEQDQLTHRVIGAAIEVHKHLGPGLLESIYEQCLCYELEQLGLSIQRQVQLPVQYKQMRLELDYRMDIVVEAQLVVEVKAVMDVQPVHQAQLLTYLKLSGIRKGLLLNFHTARLRDGIHRMVL